MNTMKAVVTRGHGGYEQLDYADVPMPKPAAQEVLLQVLAAGINNTDINTRLGWYGNGSGASGDSPAGWNGTTLFPLIQGADCCGRVIEVGSPGSAGLLGARVLVRSCMRTTDFSSMDTRWLGTDFDGAFAQFVTVPATEVFPVRSDWSDIALATIPCAYGTAENMLHRANVTARDHVLVTGASGGVGSAALQLALRRGATVTALTSKDKVDAVRALGATRVLSRDDPPALADAIPGFDVIVDNVAGAAFPLMLKRLRRGGRYVTSGAIAGSDVALDMRELYLSDRTLIGTTAWDESVFDNLIGYIERGEIRPLVAGSFALADIAHAQRVFQDKSHVGNLVLVP
jgi:NADPH:quinone reductase-like Zn-dependent oxidoreductase